MQDKAYECIVLLWRWIFTFKHSILNFKILKKIQWNHSAQIETRQTPIVCTGLPAKLEHAYLEQLLFSNFTNIAPSFLLNQC